MNSYRKTLTAGMVSLAALFASNAAAEAGCTPSVTSDGTNTCVGTGALSANDGLYNTAVGNDTLSANVNGQMNTAMGTKALYANINGNYNTGVGYVALLQNTSGQSNVGFGQSALESNTTGSLNTAIGSFTLWSNRTGQNNIALGAYAGSNQKSGSNNISIGAFGAAADSGVIRIGKAGTQRATFIAGINGTMVSSAVPVLVKANGQLGIASSAARYEQDIEPMGGASSALMQLRPVTFRHKQAEENGSRPLQYGLIADEVAKVMPDLAVYNADGLPEAVAYQILPSLLLNEYQKQAVKLEAVEKKLEDTEARLAALESEMAAMKLSRSPVVASIAGQAETVSLRQ